MNLKGAGPFNQLLTMDSLPVSGPINDSKLEIIRQGAIIFTEENIVDVGNFSELQKKYPEIDFITPSTPSVCLPGFIDVHTHICWGGSRAADYASRIGGKSYLEIAKEGGGISVSVEGTRNASELELKNGLIERALRHLKEGVTTCEVKSGYGLNKDSELKILEVINDVNNCLPIDLIPTVLSAHIKPFDFNGTHREYLDYVLNEILPEVLINKLSDRVDIFIDEGAFSLEDGKYFLKKAREMGFFLTVHSDQFTPGSSRLAVQYNALSADHLESISENDMDIFSESHTAAVALPGCSLGLGMNYAPARKLLDKGASLVISTDWNPGSAPMGDLLMQASILSAAEKLSTAETFSAITARAARALNLPDRGLLAKGFRADFILFPTGDYKDILYNQGKMKPYSVWKKGKEV
ncbi:MAG: imidazolonepropionase [Spirochaetaceae bacterium]|jgi:imidazolonepropionase|nr:imidazolonepropionase [Spirochaetaceae bacterium]